ncbi:MAG: hypothetical protein Roseis2KO_11580 [Roseivirga sp.]
MKKALRRLKRTVLGLTALILLIVIPVFLDRLIENIRASSLSIQEQQLEDIDRLDYLIRNEFPDYSVFDKDKNFANHLKSLKQQVNITAMESNSLNLEMIKAVGHLQDAHTAIGNFRELFPYTFPYNASWYEEGFYLTSGQFDPKWLGARIIRFENTSGQEVFNKLEAYTFSSNKTGRAYFMSLYEASPQLLYHEGVISSTDKINLTVVSEHGDSTTLSFNKVLNTETGSLQGWSSISAKYEDQKPLWKTNPEKNYWYKYLEQEDLMYLRYSMCVAQGDIEVFWNDLFDHIDQKQPEKLVLDIRRNPGGDSQNHISFLKKLTEDSILNQPGKLFTLIDRGTGSAAINLASQMERLTHSILVGEKTLDKANTTSDPTYYSLPHSGIQLILPNLYSLHSYIFDKRDAINPDHFINIGMLSYYTQDEALDYVRAYKPELPANTTARVNLPAAFEGQYTFSPIRNMSLTKIGNDWYVLVDDLTHSRLLRRDSFLIAEKYPIKLLIQDSLNRKMTLSIHNSEMETAPLATNSSSLMQNIMNMKFTRVREQLKELQSEGELPYYLDRPFFQTSTYLLYDQHGFEAAHELNKITRSFFPDDPIVSIIDYELYQRESHTFGKIKSLFPIAGKAIKRYYTVITTDRVMNDDYNPFIGR